MLAYAVSLKFPRFSDIFPNSWEFLVQILRAYYMFLSTIDYKFLINYMQLWQSYAILSVTTQHAFFADGGLFEHMMVVGLNIAELRQCCR